ncbi:MULTISPECIES: 4Fe-4S binding protein [Clostridium]|uniref:Ferredoxin n=1 Tax=Clostridium ragsdalei P11 TaxID=1353534 RepID=A0A1A6AZP6_9CLOT|nr:MULTISPECIES: 4Fe-4S binding protein [Clostridium]OBR95503.1 ferredoxin [Clostridium ragsdalei P11]QXE18001.1 hypothetical protein B5S50_03590 [Clostridium sp. 001]
MLISSVTTIYFSPTGTTKKIINSIVKGMKIINNKIIDLTLPKVREAGVPLIDGDIVLIGVPVYEEKISQGKLPLMAKIVPKNSARLFTKTPFADMSKCSHCNICVKLCPMNAIDKETLEIDEEQCLRCFCCAKRCPKKARKIIYKPRFLVSKVLTMKNRIIKEPKLYL